MLVSGGSPVNALFREEGDVWCLARPVRLTVGKVADGQQELPTLGFAVTSEEASAAK